MTTLIKPKNIPETEDAFVLLEKRMFAALQSYSNVHRGSGPAAKVTTQLFEMARTEILDFMGLNAKAYVLIFASEYHAVRLSKSLEFIPFEVLQDKKFGLHLGVTAFAIKRKLISKVEKVFTGGGTTRLYGSDWVMWTKAPDLFEAGTPAILNCIALAIALRIIKEQGSDAFRMNKNHSESAETLLFDDEWEGLKGEEMMEAMQSSWLGKDFIVPVVNGKSPYVHLDNAASTPALKAVWQVFVKAHKCSSDTRTDICNYARKYLLETFNAASEEHEIIFTLNTTESINLVAEAFSKKEHKNCEPVILGSLAEHSSNDLPWRELNNYEVIRNNVDKSGFLDLKAFENTLKAYNEQSMHGNKRIVLVALSGASNILGSINDLTSIGRLTKKYGASLLVDAAQLVAHRSIAVEKSNIDFLVFSGHKMYAPFGVSALIARKESLKMDEATMEQAKSFAFVNAGGIAALVKATAILKCIGYDLIEQHEKALVKKARQELSKIPDLKFFGSISSDKQEYYDATPVLAIEIKDKMNGKLANNLAHNAGIGTRFGCHCAHVFLKYLLDFKPFQENIQRFVLKMVPALRLQGVLRISFGLINTMSEVDLIAPNLQHKSRVSKTDYKNFVQERIRLVYGDPPN